MVKPGPKGSRAKSRELALRVVELHGTDENPGASISMIAAELNVSRAMVCEWLKKGRKILAAEKAKGASVEVAEG